MPGKPDLTLSEFERRRVDRIFAQHCKTLETPEHRATRQLRYRLEGNWVTLIEYRASDDNRSEWIKRQAAQFRFDLQKRTWAVYVTDELGSWVRYEPIDDSDDLEDLLEQLQGQPTAIVWG